MNPNTTARMPEPKHRAFPALECPKCGTLRKPIGLRMDGSVTYSCPPDHVHHGDRYTWRIAEDGTLID